MDLGNYSQLTPGDKEPGAPDAADPPQPGLTPAPVPAQVARVKSPAAKSLSKVCIESYFKLLIEKEWWFFF